MSSTALCWCQDRSKNGPLTPVENWAAVVSVGGVAWVSAFVAEAEPVIWWRLSPGGRGSGEVAGVSWGASGLRARAG